MRYLSDDGSSYKKQSPELHLAVGPLSGSPSDSVLLDSKHPSSNIEHLAQPLPVDTCMARLMPSQGKKCKGEVEINWRCGIPDDDDGGNRYSPRFRIQLRGCWHGLIMRFSSCQYV